MIVKKKKPELKIREEDMTKIIKIRLLSSAFFVLDHYDASFSVASEGWVP